MLSTDTVPAPVKDFQPSPYQAAIFEFIASGQGNGVVNAVAGSGKTTTLVHAARLVNVPSLFIAFNKHIAEELQRRLVGTTMTAMTVHAFGRAQLAKSVDTYLQVDGRKYNKLVTDYVKKNVDPSDREVVADRLVKLVNFARLTLTDLRDRQAVDDMSWRYDVDFEETDIDVARRLLGEGDRMARFEGVIDFTDMIFLPVKWNLPVEQYEYIFVDEAQDLNRCQQELIRRALAPKGRILFVGDRRQSIMAFAGADPQSFDYLKTLFNATELPLSICYRCPASHVRLAQTIVADIEAAPTAPEGVVESVKVEDMTKRLQPGHMVLCRATAPLVSLCLSLIREGVNARVKGKDIGAGMAKLIRAVEKMPSYTWSRFPFFLAKYSDSQIDRMVKRDAPPSRIEAMQDQVEAILAMYETAEVRSGEELAAKIEGLFSDDKPSVQLSTIHRAKGLEGPTVWIIDYHKLPVRRPKMKDFEREQEDNVHYVALTRSKAELYLVG